MGVTDGVVKQSLFLTVLFALSLVGCGVDVSSTTPNSFLCNPGPNDLAAFQSQVVASGTGYNAAKLNGQTCFTCHGTSSADTRTRGSVFHIQDVNITDPGVEKENFCVAYMMGQLDPSHRLINHPQDAKHDGGQYTATDISGLIGWVQNATITGN